MKFNAARTTLIVLNAMALSTFVGIDGVNAQYPSNFVDFSQSRQFFEQGNQKIEAELGWLQTEKKLPKIELPEDLEFSQSINNSLTIEHRLKLKPLADDDLKPMP